MMAAPFSAHQTVLALPFAANPDVLSLAFGANPHVLSLAFGANLDVLALPFSASKDHPSITSWCHQTRSLWSLCSPTVPFSLFSMAQPTPVEWPWVCPTAPSVGSDLILLLAGC